VVGTPGDGRAEEIIKALDLRPIPKESGLRGVIGRTLPETLVEGKPMAVQSRNYFMLTRALPVRFVHRLESEETHILVEGGTVDVYVFCNNGRAEKQTMTHAFTKDDEPIAVVPPGCFQAEVLRPEADFALMVSTQAPEWRSDRERVGGGPEWVRRYVGKAEWATGEFLRKLVGPNWE
jgi:predicted cupin superfamily sugar epimerase